MITIKFATKDGNETPLDLFGFLNQEFNNQFEKYTINNEEKFLRIHATNGVSCGCSFSLLENCENIEEVKDLLRTLFSIIVKS